MFNSPRPHIHRTVDSPCRKCGDRHIGCHGGCERYSDYRTALDAEKEAAFVANIDGHRANYYEIEAAKRYRR